MNKIVLSNLTNLRKLAVHVAVVTAVAALGTAGVELSNIINTLPNVPLPYAIAVTAAIADVVRVLTVELRGVDQWPSDPTPQPPMA